MDENGRAAVEPSIGHLKTEHTGWSANRLKGVAGDALNAIPECRGDELP